MLTTYERGARHVFLFDFRSCAFERVWGCPPPRTSATEYGRHLEQYTSPISFY